ncbi:MAG: AAA family ATPase, partial [Deltaproteobacteria bacterium]|nr:AAA family ATPase [Deltaproteobacteria bacterium]
MREEPILKELQGSIHVFSEIIQGNYVYADKTRYIYGLIRKNDQYFLSRPRRFGKSLLLDTIEEIFLGHRELFKGLWIDSSDYDWLPHPVIHLDLAPAPISSVSKLEMSISLDLRKIARKEKIQAYGEDPASILKSLLTDLSDKYNRKVVVLVDEYDAPILDSLTNQALAEEIRTFLKRFYATLKSEAKQIRFVFLTGVSKFAQTSIFSGANQFTDISLDPDYSNICGFTHDEFDDLFSNRLPEVLDFLKTEAVLSKETTIDD